MYKDGGYSAVSVAAAACIGFLTGIIAGAALALAVRHFDEKERQLSKLRRDTDENYLYSE
ncbi:MAG: hypothetical protein IJ874_07550 [Ruminococcus sp.]|nr:hypothetical protein [Ruminococcus sp.]